VIQPKVIPKFYRLKLTDALRALLRALPIKKFVEVHDGDYIYLGKGLLKWGKRYRTSQIRIVIRKNRITVSIRTEIGAIVCPFNNSKEREIAIQRIKEKLEMDWD
jgi:hypothetical protein